MTKELKTIEDYLALPYTEWVRPDEEEGGFYAGVEEFPGCLADGETRTEALERLQDAKRAWLGATLENGDRVPVPLELEDYSGKILVRAPKSLHRDLAHRAALEGVSLNQLCVSLLSRGIGVPFPSQAHESVLIQSILDEVLSRSTSAWHFAGQQGQKAKAGSDPES